jgi:hypothetical protein
LSVAFDSDSDFDREGHGLSRAGATFLASFARSGDFDRVGRALLSVAFDSDFDFDLDSDLSS